MEKNSTIYKITKIIVDITLIVGIISCFLVPFYVNYIGDKYNFILRTKIIFDVVIILAGIATIYILWQLRKVLKNVLDNNPFTIDTIKSLRMIAISIASISVVFLIKFIFIPTITTFVLILAFALGTLLFLTLKDLFKQALFYKEENEGVI